MIQTLRRSWLSLTVFVVIAVLVTIYAADNHPITGVAGTVMLLILGTKLALAMTYRPVTGEAPAGLRVTVAVAAYNEDPDTLAGCLRSILRQTRPPDRVHVVDDGSTTDEVYERAWAMAPEFYALGIEFEVTRLVENLGKREALAVVFRADPDAGAYLCVDSDTILARRALHEVIKPMVDPRVQVVTGLVLAANRSTNVLTRLINLRYGNAFAYERAAYSRLAGSVLCACGSLALYRAQMVRDSLDDFTGQMFLGKPAVAGDDRRMTNYGLMVGRAVYQETARADTAVPERFTHFLRQQVRWNRSFFRESAWVLRHMSPSKPAWWLTGVELGTWLIFTGFVATAGVRAVMGEGDVLAYLTYITLFGYARSVRYLDLPDVRSNLAQRVAAFALAPLYGGLHVVALTPIRLYALATLTRGSWGTRDEVEVALSPADTGVTPREPATVT